MTEEEKITVDGKGIPLKEGDTVFTYDLCGDMCFGTFHKNINHPEVSEWYIQYDDEACAVLDIFEVFKVYAL